ncbi:MAG: NAD(P)-binding protein [Pyrinomonadaceae bacterium]
MIGKPQLLIVGAGLAGLTCAWNLDRAGILFHILEAANSVGGRGLLRRLGCESR